MTKPLVSAEARHAAIVAVAQGKTSVAKAARLLGVSERSVRRYREQLLSRPVANEASRDRLVERLNQLERRVARLETAALDRLLRGVRDATE